MFYRQRERVLTIQAVSKLRLYNHKSTNACLSCRFRYRVSQRYVCAYAGEKTAVGKSAKRCEPYELVVVLAILNYTIGCCGCNFIGQLRTLQKYMGEEMVRSTLLQQLINLVSHSERVARSTTVKRSANRRLSLKKTKDGNRW